MMGNEYYRCGRCPDWHAVGTGCKPKRLLPERAKPRITVKRCALPTLMLGARKMIAYSDEWEREANRMARERVFIHPCDDCGYPQIDFKCNNCGRQSW